MQCCWDSGFDSNLVDHKPWSLTTGGWMDIATAFVTSDVFSGVPDWLGGEESLFAWRTYTDAIVRFVQSNVPPHHHGFPDQAAYTSTLAGERFGGVAPVAVFVVPDYYMNYPALRFRNTFRFTSAIDFKGDLNTSIPAQLMDDPFFLEWRTWRDTTPGQGVPANELPDSVSEDDIDINFTYVHFDGLRMAGGFFYHVNTLFSVYGGRLMTALQGEVPRLADPIEGLSIPIIFVERTAWLGNVALGSTEQAITDAAQSAGPAPNVRDATILDGYNRVYPNDQRPRLRFYVNGKHLEWTIMDWQDQNAAANLYPLFQWSPVQGYSAPSAFQRGE